MLSKNILAGRTHSPSTFAIEGAVHDHLLQRLGVLGKTLKAVASALEVYELAAYEIVAVFCHGFRLLFSRFSLSLGVGGFIPAFARCCFCSAVSRLVFTSPICKSLLVQTSTHVGS